jgi:hypothetical protein
MIDVLSYNSSRVVKGKRNPGANAFILDHGSGVGPSQPLDITG